MIIIQGRELNEDKSIVRKLETNLLSLTRAFAVIGKKIFLSNGRCDLGISELFRTIVLGET